LWSGNEEWGSNSYNQHDDDRNCCTHQHDMERKGVRAARRAQAVESSDHYGEYTKFTALDHLQTGTKVFITR